MKNNLGINCIRGNFEIGARSMRAFEGEIAIHSHYFKKNLKVVVDCVTEIVEQIERGKSNK